MYNRAVLNAAVSRNFCFPAKCRHLCSLRETRNCKLAFNSSSELIVSVLYLLPRLFTSDAVMSVGAAGLLPFCGWTTMADTSSSKFIPEPVTGDWGDDERSSSAARFSSSPVTLKQGKRRNGGKQYYKVYSEGYIV